MPFSVGGSYPFSIHVHTNGHYKLLPADLLFHSSPTFALDFLSTSCPLSLLHTYFSPWLFQFSAKFLSHSGLGIMSRFHEALRNSHKFCTHSIIDSQRKCFPQSRSWQSLNFTHINVALVQQLLHIHLLSLFYQLYMKNLSVFTHYLAILFPDLLHFGDTHYTSYI